MSLYTARAINPIIEVVSTPPCGHQLEEDKAEERERERGRERNCRGSVRGERRIYVDVFW
jgi:hypothetical protein